ncbi:MAG: hypothetical protein ACI9GH_000607 [Candidatus Paceibacteria bacterium]|jgi:hypothetical protein
MQAYSFAQVVQISLLDLWGRVVGILPDLVGAIFIIFIGLLVAPIFGGCAKRLVDVLKIDQLAEKMGIHEMVKGYSNKLSVSRIVGKLVKWFFILAFVMAAAEVLQWDRITSFLEEIIFYIPNVLIAVIVLVFGVIAGKFFEIIVVRSLQGAEAPVNNPELLGKITRWSFVVFAVSAALIQLGVAQSLIAILFAGIVLALALAFGLGGRDHASNLLSHVCGKKK